MGGRAEPTTPHHSPPRCARFPASCRSRAETPNAAGSATRGSKRNTTARPSCSSAANPASARRVSHRSSHEPRTTTAASSCSAVATNTCAARSRRGSRPCARSSPRSTSRCCASTSPGAAASSPASCPSSRTASPTFRQPQTADAETERFLLFDAVVDLLSAVAAEQPLMFVFDDAHWADAGSVQLLRHACAHFAPETRVLVVVTYRDTDIDRSHPLSGVLADLRRAAARRALRPPRPRRARHASAPRRGGRCRSRRRRRRVRPPSRRGDRGQSLLRHRGDPPPRRDQHARAARRPLGRRGRGRGHRACPKVCATSSAGASRSCPTTPTRRCASRPSSGASSTSTSSPPSPTAPRTPWSTGSTKRSASRLVDEVADRANRLTFSHALVRSTLIDELSTNRRVRLHKRIGEALEARGAPVVELAHHFCEAATAGGAERAVRYACEAGTARRRASSRSTTRSASSSARSTRSTRSTRRAPRPTSSAPSVLVAARDGRARPRRRRARPEPRARSRHPRPPARRRRATRRSGPRLPGQPRDVGPPRRRDRHRDHAGGARAARRHRARSARPRQGGHRVRIDPRGRRRRSARRRRSGRARGRSRRRRGDEHRPLCARVVGVGERPGPRTARGRRRRSSPPASDPAHRNWVQSGEWHVGHALLVAGDIEGASRGRSRAARAAEGALTGWGDASIRTALAYAREVRRGGRALRGSAHARRRSRRHQRGPVGSTGTDLEHRARQRCGGACELRDRRAHRDHRDRDRPRVAHRSPRAISTRRAS